MNEDDTFRKLKKLPFDEARGRYLAFGKRAIDGPDIEDFWESIGWTSEEYFSKIYDSTIINLQRHMELYRK